MAPSSFSSSEAISALALSDVCDRLDRGCAWRTLLSEPVRDLAGVAVGVPMFARALREFMLRPTPCTGRTCRTRDVFVRGLRAVECGVAATFVWWERLVGAYVMVWLAGT